MKGRIANGRTRSSLPVFVVIGLCCFFYILGAWQKSGSGKGDNIAVEITKQTNCTFFPNLIFDTHHNREDPDDELGPEVETFEPCNDRYTDYTPCHDPIHARKFPRENMNYRERHCPLEEEKLRCLIPPPKGYLTPFSWPRSREFVPFANVPYKSLAAEEAQNWIRYEGNVFRFPVAGLQFPHGVEAYIDQLASVIPIGNGTIRTALDTGCGVASWGAYMLQRNVLTMSFAPRDLHEARVQFALERGVPAVIGVLGTIKLPYPPSSFDMAHCSRCPIPWEENDGMYMMELDRVLRPGGYWVLSGRPPINWKNNYKAWGRTEADLEAQQKKIEEIADLLCWEKIFEKDDIAIWRKRTNIETCARTQHESHYRICDSSYADDVWYKKMEACLVPIPIAKSPQEIYGGVLKPYPDRLNSVPSRVLSGYVAGYSAHLYQEDTKLWRKHVKAYKRINKFLDTGRYRNIMDMNAGLGSFAAAIESPKLWVMNVVPTIAEKSTLSAVYDRGLIGTYHDWCEAFSTYPRTYDLIHANGVFSLYKNKCKMDDILLEMDRILRPEGAVIFRDDADTLKKVKRMVRGMRWKTRMIEHEDGPLLPEKILFAVKQYWVSGDSYSTM